MTIETGHIDLYITHRNGNQLLYKTLRSGDEYEIPPSHGPWIWYADERSILLPGRPRPVKSGGTEADTKTAIRLWLLAHASVKQRVAAALVQEAAESEQMMTHPDGFQIKITRAKVSDIVGASREMVGRTMTELEVAGWIRARGKTVVVTHKLAELVDITEIA